MAGYFAAMAQGLMVYPMAGTVDGKNGDHILIAPPFISSEADLTAIVARLGKAVDVALASCRRQGVAID